MPEVTLPVRNLSGLHTRPAADFVKAASRFRCQLRISNVTRDPDRYGDAKSILSVLALGVSPGHEVHLMAEGDDADEALTALRELIASGFGEPAIP